MDNPNPTETVKTFWENTYRQNISKLIGVGYRYTADRQIAEDLSQDAFIIAYQKIESFKGKGPFEAWLRRIMVNVCLQYLREHHKKKYLDDWLKNETSTVETTQENISEPNSAFTEAILLEAINQLPEHHKLVFNLYVLDQFTHVQIGKELGISEGTSKSHLARARKKIKEILNEKPRTEKKERKKAAFLLIFWNIDSLYKKQLKNFGLTSHKAFSFDSISTQTAGAYLTGATIPALKTLSVFKIVSIIAVTLTLTGTVYLQFVKKGSGHPPDISSVLKNDSVVLQSKVVSDTPSGAGSYTGKRISHVTTNMDVTGSFYAEKLFWSAENNKLYFQGKASIVFGDKNYVSDSSISFLGKVYYLVLDGKIVQLQSEAKQDVKLSGKKYNLTRLSPNSAVGKYGENGRRGAIEISLAE